MGAPKYRTGVDPVENDRVSDETGLECKDPSRAVQSQKDDADINVIVGRFLRTGEVPQVVRPPLVGDFSGVGDLTECFAVVREAQAAFELISPGIRQRFGDDPVKFVEFCSDRANLEELRKLGLALPGPESSSSSGASSPPTA